MNNKDRRKCIEELKEICIDIGCSGLSPDMCNNNPHLCEIIRKIIKPPNYKIKGELNHVY